MSINLIALALVQAPSGNLPACNRLIAECIRPEDTFGFISDLNQQSLAADRQLAAASGDYSRVLRQGRENLEADQRAKADRDRLIALMTGQGCRLPDHIFSASTYRPQRLACEAARNTPDEQQACAYLERAIAAATAPPPPRRLQARRR